MDSTRTVLRLKAKERKFISSATPLPYGRFQPNNELYQFYGNYYNSKIYGLRSNGDTIRPKYNSALKYSNYGSNWQSLAAAVYWKKEINEDTGAAIYTLELH